MCDWEIGAFPGGGGKGGVFAAGGIQAATIGIRTQHFEPEHR